MAQRLSRREFIDRTQRIALATPFLSLVGCSQESAASGLTLGGKTMGTSYSVSLAELPRGLNQDNLTAEIDAVLDSVNRRMSTYRPDSELSQLNAAPAGSWVPVSDDTRMVIDEALRVGRLTGGAFDSTVGPLVDLWGFGPDGGQDRVPAAEAIATARETVGFDKIETKVGSAEGNAGAARKQSDGVRLDLSGVAKGFGVDQVARHLEARDIADYLVEVGGELRASGHGPGGRSWRVGIEAPNAVPGDLQQVVELEGAALATSGNYRIFFEADGQRYSHIVDPTTGRPVSHDLASASVVAATTMEADALSTSMLVLGPEAGLALATEHDIAAFFITGRDGVFSETASPAFTRRFKA